MKTEIIKLDSRKPDIQGIRHAADVLREGGLVAFPTETVYGLGANALNTQAVKKIFEAKGRPADNPLIVHIADTSSVKPLVSVIPPFVCGLMDKFWPGPLTLIMDKSELVPPIITANLDTVAIRMPVHPVAMAMIRESGLPIAAPSANTSGKPSPTCAKHVIDDLAGKVDVIIDAGNADIGLESTVLDTTVQPPAILRPGGITYEQLSAELGEVFIDPSLLIKDINVIPKAPGMKYKHYSPKADVIIVEGEPAAIAGKINELVSEQKQKGLKAGVLATEQTRNCYSGVEIISAGSRDNPESIAASLFGALREFDERKVDIIFAEAIDTTGIGLAVMNRMKKAAGYHIVKA